MNPPFFYDSLVRRVWIEGKKRPVVRVTGSHKHSCLFGAISIDDKQLFRQYDKFNSYTFLDFLKFIHHKFPKCYLFMIKASITSLQVKKGNGLPRQEQGYPNTSIPSNSVP